jgi:hypothetical protein
MECFKNHGFENGGFEVGFFITAENPSTTSTPRLRSGQASLSINKLRAGAEDTEGFARLWRFATRMANKSQLSVFSSLRDCDTLSPRPQMRCERLFF